MGIIMSKDTGVTSNWIGEWIERNTGLLTSYTTASDDLKGLLSEMTTFVVNGAQMECSEGSAPGDLIIEKDDSLEKIGNQYQANITHCKENNFSSGQFKVCSIKERVKKEAKEELEAELNKVKSKENKWYNKIASFFSSIFGGSGSKESASIEAQIAKLGDCPCEIEIAGDATWENGKEDALVGNEPALIMTSTLACNLGGEIKFVNNGQDWDKNEYEDLLDDIKKFIKLINQIGFHNKDDSPWNIWKMMELFNGMNFCGLLEKDYLIKHFLAQIFHESAFGTRVTEMYNLEECGIGKNIHSHPNAEDYFNMHYAGVNGNGDYASGDGSFYRGIGYIQVTGRVCYEYVQRVTGDDNIMSGGYDYVKDYPGLAAAAWFKDQCADDINADTLPTAVSEKVNYYDTDTFPARAAYYEEISEIYDEKYK